MASGTGAVPTQKSLQPRSDAIPILERAISQIESEDGWVMLSEVATRVSNLFSDFDVRSYGHSKFSDLVRKTGAFEIEEQAKGGSVRIRVKAATGSQPKARAPRGHREAASKA